MQLITGEFLLLSLLLLTFTRLKTHLLKSERVLRGLRLFSAPTDEELKQYADSPHKFLISYRVMDDRTSSQSAFFPETDFLVLISAVALLLSLVSAFLRLFFEFEQTFSFYSCILVISLCISGLYQHFLRSKFLSPDNAIAVVFSLTLFCLSAVCLLTEFHEYLDFDFHVSLRLLSLQLTYAMQHAWDASFNYDYTAFALLLSGLFMVLMLPVFGFVLRSTLSFYAGDADINASTILPKLLMAAPVLCVPLWIKPMCKDVLVPDYLSEVTLGYIRIGIVALFVSIRLFTIRMQVQQFLDQTVRIVYAMFGETEKELREHAKQQVRAINIMAWVRAHQIISVALLAGFFCVLELKKGSVASLLPIKNAEIVVLEEFDDEEFSVPPSIQTHIFSPPSDTRAITFKEILDLEAKIKEMKSQEHSEEDLEGFVSKVVLMNRTGFVPALFYRDLFNYCLFWYHVHWALSTAFAILYSRRFGGNKIKVG